MPSDLPPEFWQGVEQFNQGDFYACHDTLEAIWIPAIEPEKQLYQGIIQISVALYHLGNLNWRGAVILMGEGLNRLRHYPDEHEGLELGQFRSEIADLLTTLQHLGAEQVSQFAWQSVPENQAAENQAAENQAIAGTIQYPRPILQKVV